MSGIEPEVIAHQLNVNPSYKPARQKKKFFNLKRYKAIAEEVNKLLEARFIRAVHYPSWLANVVMVKKPYGKWRICIDFYDLNKAYSKDNFPLPRSFS